MVRTIGVSELKTRCLRVVDEVARLRRSVVITKRGRPVARLVPMDELEEPDRGMRLRGTLIAGGDTVEDFDTGVAWEAARR